MGKQMSVNKKSISAKIMMCLSVLLITLFSYSAASAACPEKSVGSNYGNSVSTGNTADSGNDINTSCGGTGVSDVSISFTAPFDVEWTFDTLGSNFDTVIAVLDGSCAGDELACNDDINGPTVKASSVTVRVNTGQTVIVNIEGYNGTTSGNYVLNITPTCTPQCSGRLCGDNGCGGVCGVCNDGNDCTNDVCNEETGTCSATNYVTGTACDDGFFCTVGEYCTAGTCGNGTAKSCQDEATPCQTGYCNENTNACEFEDFADGQSCDDGLYCTVGEYCTNGACTNGTPKSCSQLTDDCNVGECDEELNSCVANSSIKEGSSCNDGNICTSNDECTGGECIGGPAVDCSHLDSQCAAGACDSVTGDCISLPINNGLACDDGKFCKVDTVCTNGTCGGGKDYDCSSVEEECVVGICNENFQRCDPVPVPDGGSCDDGVFCTVGETCTNGLCGEGTARDCSSLTDQCNVGYCDSVADACVANTLAKHGDACDDGRYCTLEDTCDNGVCTGGSIRTCSSYTTTCKVGTCDLIADVCYGDPDPKEGQSCDDGLFCTEDTICSSGTCSGGTPVDCSSYSNQCNTGYCDEDLNKCSTEYDSKENQSCDDGKYCTVGERCRRGDCTSGDQRNCDTYADQCNVGLCDENLDTCYSEPNVMNGSSCNDSQYCTVGEKCNNGVCEGGNARDCSAAVTEEQCQEGVCNEDANICQAVSANEGASCDDGLFCVVNESCQNGVCTGDMKDCSGVVTDSQCETGICDDLWDRCEPEPINEGFPCDDGVFCNVGEVCNEGVCTGGQERDCSEAIGDEQCQVATCNEDEQSCDAQTANDGAECEDGLFCTVNETCTDGVCGDGVPRDCSEAVADTQCQTEACDEENDACTPNNVEDGIECDDELNCTENDQCTSGECGGSAIDCSDGTDCTVDTCDEVEGCVSTVDDDFCDTDDDLCTAGVCDPVEGCSIVQLEDWTVCEESAGEVSVCLFDICTAIQENDRCEGAAEMSVGGLINTLISKYHPQKTLTAPCSDVDYNGPDSFYKVYVKAMTDYVVTFTHDAEVEMKIVLWDSCDETATCFTLEDITEENGESTYLLHGEDIAEDMFVVIHVIAKEPLQGDVSGTYLFEFNKYSLEDGDADLEFEEELEEELEAELEEEVEEEAEVEEIEPECIAGEKECRGPLTVVQCDEDGTRWNVFEDCSKTDAYCSDGECVSDTDGDEDLDLDAEPEVDNVIDGDVTDNSEQEVEMDAEIEEESSGCNQSGGSVPFALILLLGLLAVRKRLFV